MDSFTLDKNSTSLKQRVSSLLAENIPDKMFIGKSYIECQVANLTFGQGYIIWTMTGNGNNYQIPQEYIAKNSAEIPCYYPDFYSFVEFVRQVNEVVMKYVTVAELLERIKQVAVIVNYHFKTSFINLKDKAFHFPLFGSIQYNDVTASKYKSYKETCAEELRADQIASHLPRHHLVKSTTFVSYLRSLMPTPSANAEKEISNAKLFLVNAQILSSGTNEALSELTPQIVQARLEEFDILYQRSWIELLNKNIHQADLDAFVAHNNANAIYASIKLGERVKVPYAAAYVYLQQKLKEQEQQNRARSDPKFASQLAAQARVAKFSINN